MGTNYYWANGLLAALFNATTFANVIENASVGPITQFWLALHNADPGPSGNQATSEVAYTGYDRISVARTTGGWTVPSSGMTFLAALLSFPTCTGGADTAAFGSIGFAQTGPGAIFYSGPITPNIPIESGVEPQFTTGSSVAQT